MNKENSVWNPHKKTLTNSEAVRNCEIRKNSIEYKIFCMLRNLDPHDINNVGAFLQRAGA